MSMQTTPLVANQPIQPVQAMQPMQPVVVVENSPMPINTTTVVNAGAPPMVMIADFQTGICDCFSDPGVCCIACCFPCVTYGQIERLLQTNGADPSTDIGQCSLCCCVSAAGNAALSFVGCPGIVHAFFICGQRKRYRQRTNIFGGGDCEDAAWSCCCPHCALAQVYLEETRYHVLSKNLGAPPQQMMIAGASPAAVTVVSSSGTQPMPAMYAMPPQAGYTQPAYVAMPQGYSGSQSMYGQPASQPYYAQPLQPGVSTQPPSYGQPYYTQNPQ